MFASNQPTTPIKSFSNTQEYAPLCATCASLSRSGNLTQTVAMPRRTLYWTNEDTTATTKASATSTRITKRQRVDSPREVDHTGASGITRHGGIDALRNPSSSPPPLPPSQEPMREGPNEDDMWMMVEDEFLTTAQAFTSHLHRAEYQRLKRLVRSRNESTIRNIQRPTDGRTPQSVETRMKLEARDLQVKQSRVNGIIQEAVEDDDEEDDPWLQNPRLAGLMNNHDTSQKLASAIGLKAKARTSQSQSQRVDGMSSSPPELPDLDGSSSPAPRNTPHNYGGTAVSKIASDRSIIRPRTTQNDLSSARRGCDREDMSRTKPGLTTSTRDMISPSPRPRAGFKQTSSTEESRVKARSAFDWNGLDAPAPRTSITASSRTPKKKAGAKPVTSLDEIPTFLI